MQHENIKQEKKPGENKLTGNDSDLQQEKVAFSKERLRYRTR